MARDDTSAGHHVGRRHLDPRHDKGDWWPGRDAPPEHQGGGPRPPLRDNQEEDRRG